MSFLALVSIQTAKVGLGKELMIHAAGDVKSWFGI